jgi:hypothetical protein
VAMKPYQQSFIATHVAPTRFCSAAFFYKTPPRPSPTLSASSVANAISGRNQ